VTVAGGVPVVTVLVPVLDEAEDVHRALGAVLAQDHPPDAVEIVVVDGGSTDGTGAVVRDLLAGARVRRAVVVENPGGTTPSNLNAGLAAATGEVVCRVDARSLPGPHHLRRCAELLAADPTRMVVGGAQVAVARDGSTTARGIARALNNRWGMGLARYRRGAGSGPTDTVYLGAFRTEDLRRVGGWDERFPTNQDFELNRRLGRRGVVWFDDALEVGYLGRPTLRGLFDQYRRFGSWKVAYWRTTDDRPRPRQLVLLGVLPAGVVASVAVAALPRRWRWGVAAAAVAGAVAVDVTGSADRSAPLGVRVTGLVASAAIGVGWTLGVWEGSVRRRPTGGPPPR
jgi:glycosyltransferase involved in cell wall biosynthesis